MQPDDAAARRRGLVALGDELFGRAAGLPGCERHLERSSAERMAEETAPIHERVIGPNAIRPRSAG